MIERRLVGNTRKLDVFIGCFGTRHIQGIAILLISYRIVLRFPFLGVTSIETDEGIWCAKVQKEDAVEKLVVHHLVKLQA